MYEQLDAEANQRERGELAVDEIEASVQPSLHFPKLMQESQEALRKLKAERRGYYNKLFTDLYNLIPEFPEAMSPREKNDFSTGFYKLFEANEAERERKRQAEAERERRQAEEAERERQVEEAEWKRQEAERERQEAERERQERERRQEAERQRQRQAEAEWAAKGRLGKGLLSISSVLRGLLLGLKDYPVVFLILLLSVLLLLAG